jgi:hypothetical protein
MKQALHILRKDLRHQWREIALHILILSLFAITSPLVEDGRWIGNPILPLIVTLLKFIIPVCWLVIIVRVTHEEALVGDRQFWITRPYRWHALMTAKAAFIALCIALPYITMQCVIASRAGLNPFNAGLLPTVLKHALIVWIPLFLVATVTSTLNSAFFSAIGTMLLWVLALSFVVSRDDPRTDAPYAFPVLGIFFAIIFLSILTYQYRSRDTQRSRIALVSVVAVFLLLYVGYVQMSVSFIGNVLMHIRYPLNAARALHLTYMPTPQRIFGDTSHYKSDSQSYVVLPIHLEGLDQASRLTDLHVSYNVGSNGERYVSPWRPVALTSSSMSLLVPTSYLRRTAGHDAHLQLTFAAAILSPFATQTTSLSDHFSVGDGSNCNSINAPGNPIRCGFAFDAPNPIRIDPVTPANCPPNALQSVAIHTLPTGTVIDPVRYEVLSLGGGATCHVTTVQSTIYHPSKRFSTTIDIAAINLNSYVNP